MKDVSSEQIGTALRRLAEDLVAARRRAAVLERENRELRAELEAFRQAAEKPGQRLRRHEEEMEHPSILRDSGGVGRRAPG